MDLYFKYCHNIQCHSHPDTKFQFF